MSLSKRLREWADGLLSWEDDPDVCVDIKDRRADLLAAAEALEAAEPKPWPPPAGTRDAIVYRPDAGWFEAMVGFLDDGEPVWFSAGGREDLTDQLPTHYLLPAPPEVKP